MRPKRILSVATTLALLLVITDHAPAQQGAATYRETDDDSLIVQPFNRTADDLEDMDIVGAGGEEIGEVEEVLVDASGRAVAIAAEVGGFLGVGDKEVVIGLDQLQLSSDRLATSMTKEQLEALPEWEG